jgi:DNA-binding NarL/FixJ family response regulator
VEDEVLVARMLVAWLGQHPRISVVGSAPDGLKGLQLCRDTRPDVVLIDVMMPGMDGLTLAEHLLEEMPRLKPIILSARFDPYCIYRIYRLGIPGYVDKASPPEEVTRAVLAVARGSMYQTARYAEHWHLLRSDPDAFFKVLSDREVNLVRLLAHGCDLHEIATTMEITYDTARTHQRNIRKKLGVHNSRELLVLAKKNGLF